MLGNLNLTATVLFVVIGLIAQAIEEYWGDEAASVPYLLCGCCVVWLIVGVPIWAIMKIWS